MSSYKSDFLNIMEERGFIAQCSDFSLLDNKLSTGIVTGYTGFDCTARSLHVGHLIQLLMLRWLQKTGHRPIALTGGGTTRVGDPSFKDTARPLLTDEQISENLAGIGQTFARFLKFGSGTSDAIMVNNRDWLDALSYIDFLRDYGRHFSVNRMLSFDSVRLRLDREQPLSFLEFNYMILQAYDFLELGRRYGCELQMGGSDQWGNIINGVELGRRVQGLNLIGLTSPLLTTASGAKMGKTADGAVWLNADMLSPYQYWQYWRNTEDGDVGRFLRLFTELPIEDIARLEKLEGAELNEAKKILATESTALVHGREEAQKAARAAAEVFEQGLANTQLPTITIHAEELEKGLGLLAAFVIAGLCKSNGEARRQIRGGGAKLNDQPVSDERILLDHSHLMDNGLIKLSVGRKKHVLLKPV